jgi:hypothetical protein
MMFAMRILFVHCVIVVTPRFWFAALYTLCFYSKSRFWEGNFADLHKLCTLPSPIRGWKLKGVKYAWMRNRKSAHAS